MNTCTSQRARPDPSFSYNRTENSRKTQGSNEDRYVVKIGKVLVVWPYVWSCAVLSVKCRNRYRWRTLFLFCRGPWFMRIGSALPHGQAIAFTFHIRPSVVRARFLTIPFTLPTTVPRAFSGPGYPVLLIRTWALCLGHLQCIVVVLVLRGGALQWHRCTKIYTQPRTTLGDCTKITLELSAFRFYESNVA